MSTEAPCYLIVGNEYQGISDQQNVLTIEEFFDKFKYKRNWPEENANILIGQGIDHKTRDQIKYHLHQMPIKYIEAPERLAALSLTHKSSMDNVLISSPIKSGEKEYLFDLVISDKSDRLSDHVTGHHIGAMLVMEACRQATIVVLEMDYCMPNSEPYGLILDKFNSSFTGYLFPFPSKLHVTIKEHEADPKGRSFVTTVETKIIQGGVEVICVELDVTLFKRSALEKIETMKSKKAVRNIMSLYQEKELIPFEPTGTDSLIV